MNGKKAKDRWMKGVSGRRNISNAFNEAFNSSLSLSPSLWKMKNLRVLSPFMCISKWPSPNCHFNVSHAKKKRMISESSFPVRLFHYFIFFRHNFKNFPRKKMKDKVKERERERKRHGEWKKESFFKASHKPHIN